MVKIGGRTEAGSISPPKVKRRFRDDSSQNEQIETSYKVATGNAKHRKSLADGEFPNEAFLSCSDMLFDDILKKSTIITGINVMPV